MIFYQGLQAATAQTVTYTDPTAGVHAYTVPRGTTYYCPHEFAAAFALWAQTWDAAFRWTIDNQTHRITAGGASSIAWTSATALRSWLGFATLANPTVLAAGLNSIVGDSGLHRWVLSRRAEFQPTMNTEAWEPSRVVNIIGTGETEIASAAGAVGFGARSHGFQRRGRLTVTAQTASEVATWLDFADHAQQGGPWTGFTEIASMVMGSVYSTLPRFCAQVDASADDVKIEQAYPNVKTHWRSELRICVAEVWNE